LAGLELQRRHDMKGVRSMEKILVIEKRGAAQLRMASQMQANHQCYDRDQSRDSEKDEPHKAIFLSRQLG